MAQLFRRLMAAETPVVRRRERKPPNVPHTLEEKLNEVVKNITALLHPGERANTSPRLSSTAYSDEIYELSQSQVSARHVVKSELPQFSGEYEDWLTFISTYEDTTQMCGFSPRENIIRLKQALKGKALKAVQCRLRRAEDLPEAIETLRETFGRPEMVIDSLLDQIRHSRPPKEDRLDSIVDFALSVEEICATVRKSDVERRYDNRCYKS
uniref:Uncharacterized protein n=1 Tax=Anopheles quadriannulatus TaxID=34691 RepID=A0A182XQ50_ANOQN